MKRRLICGRLGQAKFVQNAEEINEEEGKFRSIPKRVLLIQSIHRQFIYEHNMYTVLQRKLF